MRLDRRAVLAGLTVVPLAGAARAAGSARSEGGADAILDSVFATHGPPALAGGIVTRDGLIWSGVRGVRRQGTDTPATLQDRWHLGSNTKAMTAATWARLVEAGRARWDQPLTEVFPEIAADPAWAGVTLETVMAHRSGLRDEDVITLPVLLAAGGDVRPLPEQRLDLVRTALSKAPGWTQGEYGYANINFVLAGAAIERLTGQAWETAIAERLFEPLGITAFGFGAPEGDQPWGHRPFGETLIALDPATKPDNPAFMGPAGTCHMSLPDYARFVQMYLTEGGGVLSPATMARITTAPEGPGRPYGFGWLIQPSAPWAKGPVLAHEGSNTLWHATTIIDSAAGVGAIALSNAHAKGGPATQQLAQRLIIERPGA
ncbi:serine hydrolase domain-containing protein [Brevundimonas sp. Root1279]|uniref:serine hydrolase domain-containing protein n=1 Tax=Brevundimonas sp. Root1279 TaxID=1736443 RepID=UPI0006F64503|nr:serine hydrolase domain-containing protein [Brevundimonas sp. Root1279]KQW82428.1 hypothetical protein ASC65_09290 [Brevundimonas sp. Root1279]